MNDLAKKWADKAAKHLVGKTISNVRYLTDDELQDLGWYHRSLVIFFNDNSYIFSSADDEGNDAGALFTGFDDLQTIPVI